jgi:hypothetical protein
VHPGVEAGHPHDGGEVGAAYQRGSPGCPRNLDLGYRRGRNLQLACVDMLRRRASSWW